MWDRLLQVQPAFFRQYAMGDLLARVMAVSLLSQKISGTTLRTIVSSGLALLSLGLLVYYNLPLSLVALGIILVTSVVTLAAGVRTVRVLQPLQILERADGFMVQVLHGVTKLRVAGAETRAFASWRRYFLQQQALRQHVQTIQDHMTMVNTLLPTLAAVVLFWWATRLLAPAEAGTLPPLTTGTFLAVLYGLWDLYQQRHEPEYYHHGCAPRLPHYGSGPNLSWGRPQKWKLVELIRVAWESGAGACWRSATEPRGSPILDDVSIAAGPGSVSPSSGPSGVANRPSSAPVGI